MDQAIQGIDVLWSSIAVIGIGVAVWALTDSYIDRRVLRKASDYIPHGPREIMVRINIRGALASLVLHTFFLVLGILAFTAPVRPRSTSFYLVLATAYIVVALINVRAVGLNQLDRLRLRRR